MSREAEAKRREGNEIEFSRIVAFSDGVFSIAITLLVLNLLIGSGIPRDHLADEIWNQRENLVAYAISFAVIGRFWLVHHRFFGEVTAFDGKLIALNLLYLGWIVLIPFSSSLLGDYGGETISVVIYAVNLSAVILIGLWMAADARGAGLTRIDRGGGAGKPGAIHLHRRRLPALDPGRLHRSDRGAADVARPLLRPDRRGSSPATRPERAGRRYSRFAVKAIERPGREQLTASPRSVAVAMQR